MSVLLNKRYHHMFQNFPTIIKWSKIIITCSKFEFSRLFKNTVEVLSIENNCNSMLHIFWTMHTIKKEYILNSTLYNIIYEHAVRKIIKLNSTSKNISITE